MKIEVVNEDKDSSSNDGLTESLLTDSNAIYTSNKEKPESKSLK